MKFYNLETQFTFGQFEGKTLKEVAHEDPSYINWCIINLDHFYVADSTIGELFALNTGFFLTEETVKQHKAKHEYREDKILEEQHFQEYGDDYSNDYQSPEDNPFYNDALDMDQQSSEFWDNF